MSTASAPTSIPLRILLLHGFTQTPALFRAKTGALQKHFLRAFPPPKYTFTLHYCPAPHRLPLASLPGYDASTSMEEEEEAPEAYGWWRRKDGADGAVVYEGLERGMSRIAEFIREEGPFAGVVGFSQGAAAAAMVASLLEGRERKEVFERLATQRGGIPYPESFLGEEDGFVQAPLKFAVCYSGFRAPGSLYDAFYEPRIKTPVMCVMGQLDVVVEEVRGRQLVAAVEGGEESVVVHPGGHFVPSQKAWLDAVVGFAKECVEGKGKKGEKEEVRAEDMDVPF